MIYHTFLCVVNDMTKSIDQVLLKVQQESCKIGFKLTEKRQNILLLLLSSNIPLSAYDIAQRYMINYGKVIPAMSVYRILDSLIEANFVHKLKTTNQYLACAHITCSHEHGVPQFLICDKCHLISEEAAHKQLISELETSIKNTGFLMTSKQLEFHGICVSCK
jgi:Fur family zinc uptake transcriptional regulator